MAATYATTAPQGAAVKEVVNRLGLGTSGPTAGATYADVSWSGNKRAVLARITPAGTYTTGGDPIVPANYGMKEIHAILPVGADGAGAVAGSLPTIATPGTSPKLKFIAGAAELANASSVSAYVFNAIVVGI